MVLWDLFRKGITPIQKYLLDSKMSDNLIELPTLIEEKIISYRKYYILENLSPFIPKSSYYEMTPYSDSARFSAIYDERHIGKMVKFLTNIFKKAFEENSIDNITIQYLSYGDLDNTYSNIENGGEYYDTNKIEGTEIMSFFTLFGNLRIKGYGDLHSGSVILNTLKLDYIIREINMNNNPISIAQTDEQLENFKKLMEKLKNIIRT